MRRRPARRCGAALTALALVLAIPLAAHPAEVGHAFDAVNGRGLSPLDGVPLILVEQALDGSVGLVVQDEAIEVTLGADVLFDFDSADLRAGAQPALDEARQLLDRATGDVEIVGHTDSVGTDDYNDDLSLRRAEAVRAALADARHGRPRGHRRGSRGTRARRAQRDR